MINLAMATEEKNRHSVSFFGLHSKIVDYKDTLEWQELSFAAKVRTMITELLTIREEEGKKKKDTSNCL